MKSLANYKKIRPVGHREVADLFDGEVVVQEKIDGSNFSFGVLDRMLRCASRTQDLNMLVPDGQFAAPVKYLSDFSLTLKEGFIYRCEYLRSPRHNVLAYDRAPKNGLVLFEIDRVIAGAISTLAVSGAQLQIAAETLGIEAAPELFRGVLTRAEFLECFNDDWSKRESLLGGPIEGVVVKNFNRFLPCGNIIAGKFVRNEFKEVHQHKKSIDKTDPVAEIGARFGGPARWQKALQRLRDEGRLQGGPEDIGPLMKQTQADVKLECELEIKDALWAHYQRHILGLASRGLPEWWKEKLAKGEM